MYVVGMYTQNNLIRIRWRVISLTVKPTKAKHNLLCLRWHCLLNRSIFFGKYSGWDRVPPKLFQRKTLGYCWSMFFTGGLPSCRPSEWAVCLFALVWTNRLYISVYRDFCLLQTQNRPWWFFFRASSLYNSFSLPRYTTLDPVIISSLHVERKDDNDWVKRCITWEAEGIRRRGRQKKTWWDCVKKDQWLKWSCEAWGSPDEARLEQTPYPFQPH